MGTAHGPSLEEPVSIELQEPPDLPAAGAVAQAEPMVPISLVGRSLPGMTSAGNIATWRLSSTRRRRQRGGQSGLEWSGQAVLGARKPVFTALKRRPAGGKDSPVLGPGPARPGFLAVRLGQKKPWRSAGDLAVVSDLMMVAVSTAEGLRGR